MFTNLVIKISRISVIYVVLGHDHVILQFVMELFTNNCAPASVTPNFSLPIR